MKIRHISTRHICNHITHTPVYYSDNYGKIYAESLDNQLCLCGHCQQEMDAYHLPELDGSPKMEGWATSIRAKKLPGLFALYLGPRTPDEWREHVKSIIDTTSSEWWIAIHKKKKVFDWDWLVKDRADFAKMAPKMDGPIQ